MPRNMYIEIGKAGEYFNIEKEKDDSNGTKVQKWQMRRNATKQMRKTVKISFKQVASCHLQSERSDCPGKDMYLD